MGFELWMNPAEWRERVRSARSMGRPVDVTDVTSPLRGIRAPFPLEAPHVKVEALTSNWCIAGQPVEPGETYAVSAGDAQRLIDLGKARVV